MNLKIRLTASESTTAEVLYKVFDLETGAVADVRKSDFLNGTYSCLRDYSEFSKHPLAIANGVTFSTDLREVFIWTDLTNDVAYSTTKLVLRRIPAKNVEWSQGAASADMNFQEGETAHPVRLKQDYYIGVFEMTKKQCELVTDNACSGNGDNCPVVNCEFATIRDAGTWPNVSDPVAAHTVGETTILGKLRAKFNNAFAFDLPTEAQWEFACRAGTTGAIYTSPNNTPRTNTPYLNHANVICWHKGNSGRTPQPVGGLLPNAFGLYDMYGNVMEYCLDRYATYEDNGYTTGALVEDPVGALSGDARVLRVNMSAYHEYKQVRSASRATLGRADLSGFRVCLPAED